MSAWQGEGDGALHRHDGLIGEPLIGGPLFLIGIGTVVEDLLQLPEVVRSGHHVEEVPARPQHSPEFLQRQGRSSPAECPPRRPPPAGGRRRPQPTQCPSPAWRRIGEWAWKCRFPPSGGFSRGGQGPEDAGGVESLAAAHVPDHRRFAGKRQNLTTERIEKQVIIPLERKSRRAAAISRSSPARRECF